MESMESPGEQVDKNLVRRQRIHELIIALIHKQEKLELMDHDSQGLGRNISSPKENDPGRWLDRNRRIINQYQALVRSAMAIDALIDAEKSDY